MPEVSQDVKTSFKEEKMPRLAVTRAILQRIIIVVPPSDKPTRVEVVPVEVHGTNVRIAVEAPREVSIDREEVYNNKAITPGR